MNYGAIPSRIPIAHIYTPPHTRDVLPATFSLLSEQLPTPNQGVLDTCVGFMGSRLMWNRRKQLGLVDIGVPSPRQLVQDTIANEHGLQGNPKADISSFKGCGIVDMCFTAQWGIVNEKQWPYSTDKASLNKFPTPDIRAVARQHCLWDWDTFAEDGTGQYSIADMKACLYSGQTFGFGFMVWDSLKLDNNTHILTPAPTTLWDGMEGHAVVVCGWDDERQAFQFCNWYGTGYGINGCGYYRYTDMRFPYAFDILRIKRFWPENK